jgi:hypothetical protein
MKDNEKLKARKLEDKFHLSTPSGGRSKCIAGHTPPVRTTQQKRGGD